MILAARGRRIDPGPAIRSADRAAGILPLAKVRWRRAARWARTAGAGRAIMAEVLQYQRFRPAGFRNGRPARWRSTAFRDGWIAWRRRASRNAAAPRNAVSPWEAGAPRSAASQWEVVANPWLGAVARCSCTASLSRLLCGARIESQVWPCVMPLRPHCATLQ
jgi:hypothetical protein